MDSVVEVRPAPRVGSEFDRRFSGEQKDLATRIGTIIFTAVVIGGLAYALTALISDISTADDTGWGPFALLGVALLIALAFEFVNGFHDTANAVATVIYTNSLKPNLAVVWAGTWNFLGVLTASGAVAFGIISLLPVELILQVSSKAGFAMVFALLIAAILWNLGTWWLGLPASSSHTLIGSVIGVGIANSLHGGYDGTSGVDWSKATEIGYALLLSPIFGFLCAAGLFLMLRYVVRNPDLYREPEGTKPPPLWIRAILIFTCTGVSFAHGSNDGQKGMGLIMLILIGTVPTVYALNRTADAPQVPQIVAATAAADAALAPFGAVDPNDLSDPRLVLTAFLRDRTPTPETVPALRRLTADVAKQLQAYHSIQALPHQLVPNIRNDMFLSEETLRQLDRLHALPVNAEQRAAIGTYRSILQRSTRFIPDWVKVAVALALGLGTMVGWKRIVVTVGEKIGKTHMSYGQGAAAELVAMSTIAAADVYGLPVSTTHVLSSGVAGTMAASGSGLQLSTLRNLALAWVLTLPAAILLAGGLFFLFVTIF